MNEQILSSTFQQSISQVSSCKMENIMLQQSQLIELFVQIFSFLLHPVLSHWARRFYSYLIVCKDRHKVLNTLTFSVYQLARKIFLIGCRKCKRIGDSRKFWPIENTKFSDNKFSKMFAFSIQIMNKSNSVRVGF